MISLRKTNLFQYKSVFRSLFFIFLSVGLYSFNTASAEGICDRYVAAYEEEMGQFGPIFILNQMSTLAIDEILANFPNENKQCGDITSSNLANDITFVNLKFKGIKSIPEGTFAGLSGLHTLLLGGNFSLTTVPVGLFSGLNQMNIFEIDPSVRHDGIEILETTRIVNPGVTKQFQVQLNTSLNPGTSVTLHVLSTSDIVKITPNPLQWTEGGATTQLITITGERAGQTEIFFQQYVPYTYGYFSPFYRAIRTKGFAFEVRGICNRYVTTTESTSSTVVIDAIVSKVNGSSGTKGCDNITASDLANVTGTLDLSSDNIREIPGNTFVDLGNLTGLLLNDNPLTTIPTEVFATLDNLNNFDIDSDVRLGGITISGANTTVLTELVLDTTSQHEVVLEPVLSPVSDVVVNVITTTNIAVTPETLSLTANGLPTDFLNITTGIEQRQAEIYFEHIVASKTLRTDSFLYQIVLPEFTTRLLTLTDLTLTDNDENLINFSPNTLIYNPAVPISTTQVQISASLPDKFAADVAITINAPTLTTPITGEQGVVENIPLFELGNTTITVVITAPNDVQLTYEIEIIQTIMDLTLSKNGEEIINFSPNTFIYNPAVPISTTQVQISANLPAEHALDLQFTINAPTLTTPITGEQGVVENIPLFESANTTITVVITAPSDVQLTYEIEIYKQGICDRTVVTGTSTTSTVAIDAILDGIYESQQCQYGPSGVGSVVCDENRPRVRLECKDVTPEDLLSFRSLAKIFTLNLSTKDISEIPEGTFDGLNNLTRINLENNNLTSLPENIFSDLNSVKDLHLRNNGIRVLSAGIFSNMHLLLNIDLRNNPLTSIPIPLLSYNLQLSSDITPTITGISIFGLDGNPVADLTELTTHKNHDFELRLTDPLRHGGRLVILYPKGAAVLQSKLFWWPGSTTQRLTLNSSVPWENAKLSFSYYKNVLISDSSPQYVAREYITDATYFRFTQNPAALFDLRIVDSRGNKLEYPASLERFSSDKYNYVVPIYHTATEAQVFADLFPQFIGNTSYTITVYADSLLNPAEGQSGQAITVPFDINDDTANFRIEVTVESGFQSKYYVTLERQGICERIVETTSSTSSNAFIDVIAVRLGITYFPHTPRPCDLISQYDLRNIVSTVFDLTNRDFTRMPPGTFLGLKTRELNLSNNALISIEKGMFNGIENTIRSIYLNNNALTSIVAEEFSTMPNLTYVAINSNPLLHYVPIGAFAGVRDDLTLVRDSMLRINGINILGANTTTPTAQLLGSTAEYDVMLEPPLEQNDIEVHLESSNGFNVNQSSFTWIAGDTSTRAITVTAESIGPKQIIFSQDITQNDSLQTDGFLYHVKVPVQSTSIMVSEGSTASLALRIETQYAPETTVLATLQAEDARLQIIPSTIILTTEQTEVLVYAVDNSVLYLDEQSFITVSGPDIFEEKVQVITQENDTLTFTLTDPDRIVEGEVGEVKINVSSVPDTGVTVKIQSVSGLMPLETTLRFTEVGEQSIQLTATDNNTPDGNRMSTIEVSAPRYTTAYQTILILDNEVQQLHVNPLQLSFMEEANIVDRIGRLEVRVLGQAPGQTANVSLAVDDSRVMLFPNTLPGVNSIDAEQVTIIVADDDLFNQDGSGTIRLTADGLTPVEVAVTIQDNDTLTFTVEGIPTSIEEGNQTTIRVSVNGVQPSGVSSVTILAGLGLTISPAELNFTNKEFQEVILTALDTDIVEGGRQSNLQLSSTGYKTIEANIVIEDNDTLTFTVEGIPTSIEEGNQTTIRVSINGVQSAGVSSVTILAGLGLTVSPAELNFTNKEFQEVVLTALDTDIVEGGRQSSLQLSSTGYKTIEANIVIVDNDTLTISVTGEDILYEGEQIIIEVEVGGIPTSGTAVVSIGGLITGIRTTESVLVFNEKGVQTLGVVADQIEGDQQITLTFSSPLYATVTKEIELIDIDIERLKIAPLRIDNLAEGSQASFRVELITGNSPSIVTLTPIDNRLQLSSSTVTMNHREEVEIAITAIEDILYYADKNSGVALIGEHMSTAVAIAVTLEENDTLTLTVSAPATLMEGKGGDVIINVSALPAIGEGIIKLESDSELVLSETTLRFTQIGEQTIRVTATETQLAEGNRGHTITISSTDYNTQTRTIEIIDNDVVYLATNPTSLELAEGTTSTLTIQATSQVPGATTQVRLYTDDVRIQITSTLITLTGEQSEVVEIYAVDDVISYEDTSSSIRLTATNIETLDVAVTHQENDTLTMTVGPKESVLGDTEDSLIIREMSIRTLIVTLGALPITNNMSAEVQVEVENASTNLLSIDKSILTFTEPLASMEINVAAASFEISDINRKLVLTFSSVGYTDQQIVFNLRSQAVQMRLKVFLDGAR